MCTVRTFQHGGSAYTEMDRASRTKYLDTEQEKEKSPRSLMIVNKGREAKEPTAFKTPTVMVSAFSPSSGCEPGSVNSK